MLSAVQNTPYFSKYLRSQSLIAAGGKRLPQVVGQRLVALGPTWDGHLLNPPPNRVPEYFALLTASVLRLFCNLLAAFIKEEDQTQVISSRTSGQLRPMLRSWALRYPNTCLGDVSMRALGVLGGSPEYLRGVNRFIRRDVKNWKECAMPKCKVSADLKACGKCVIQFVIFIRTSLNWLLRCQTVRYVRNIFFNGLCTHFQSPVLLGTSESPLEYSVLSPQADVPSNQLLVKQNRSSCKHGADFLL